MPSYTKTPAERAEIAATVAYETWLGSGPRLLIRLHQLAAFHAIGFDADVDLTTDRALAKMDQWGDA